MFMDKTDPCVEFESVKHVKNALKESSQQTDALKFRDVECMSHHYQDEQTQTVNSSEEIRLGDYDEPKLIRFLQKTTPIIFQALQENTTSHAFSNYKLLEDVGKIDIAKLHVLKTEEVNNKLSCTGLSWNATGSIIGVVYPPIKYGCLEHEGWCKHSSRITCWNIHRRNFQPNKPHRNLEVSVCMSYIEFHPKKPSLFATGNYNGEISLWNLSYSDDPEVAKSETHDKGHVDVITHLTWIKEDGISGRFLLCSSSLDGKILTWKPSERKKQLQIIKGYIILAEDVPRTALPKKKFNGEIGVTSMSFFEDHSTFIATVEGGVIIQCSLASSKITGHILNRISLYSPIITAISSPIPYISRVQCAPSSNMFAICGPYSATYIYKANAIKDEPLALFSVNAVSDICWHPTEQSVIGVVACGKLQLHNSNTGHILRDNYLHESGNKMLIIKFNHINSKLFTIGDSAGEVHLWDLKTDNLNG